MTIEERKAKKREYAKRHYEENKKMGIVKKRYGIGICPYCGEEFVKSRPEQITHKKCFKIHKTVENYNKVGRSAKGNTLGRQIIFDLGFVLSKDMVVHHLDENPSNNNLNNLLILNRKYHAKLHRFLEKNWSLLSKDNNSNLENCWNSLRDQLTKTWLETMSVKVKKIVDISQSAAELLNEEYIYYFDYEEGSETMY